MAQQEIIVRDDFRNLLERLKSCEATNTWQLLTRYMNNEVDEDNLKPIEDRPNYLGKSVDNIARLSYATNTLVDRYEWSTEDALVTHSRRVKSKVGRMLNKIFTEEYLNEVGVTNNDIEKFVRQIKANWSDNPDVNAANNYCPSDSLRVVSGEDIVSYYNLDNYIYEAREDGMGSLGESCMRYDSCSRYIRNVYANADDVEMLIFEDERGAGEIVGRALIWRGVNFNGEKIDLMDRVYTTEDYQEEPFFLYAKKHGLYRKYKQSYSDKVNFIDPQGNKVEGCIVREFEDAHDIYSFPYVDTLTYMVTTDEGNKVYLTNHTNVNKIQELIGDKIVEVRVLESTDGDYNRTRIRNILNREGLTLTIGSQYINTYLDEIHKSSEMYSLIENAHGKGHAGQVYLCSRSFERQYCTFHNKYFLSSEMMIDSYSNDWIAKVIPSNLLMNWNGGKTLKSNFTKDHEGNFIPTSDAVGVTTLSGKVIVVHRRNHNLVKDIEGLVRFKDDVVRLKRMYIAKSEKMLIKMLSLRVNRYGETQVKIEQKYNLKPCNDVVYLDE